MFVASSADSQRIPVITEEKGSTKYTGQVISPIISEGDAMEQFLCFQQTRTQKWGMLRLN